MTCTFFGHRDAPAVLVESIREAILKLIFDGVRNFYVGNNGNFDYMVQTILSNLKKERFDITVKIVLSHIGEKALSERQELTVFPEELALVPKRFSIAKRNDYLLKSSSIVVAYAKYTSSNAYKLTQKAQKRGLTVLNLAKK